MTLLLTQTIVILLSAWIVAVLAIRYRLSARSDDLSDGERGLSVWETSTKKPDRASRACVWVVFAGCRSSLSQRSFNSKGSN